MDKYSAKPTTRALRDLDGIYGYIAQTLREPGTALKLVARIEETVCSLEQMPYRCPKCNRGANAHRGYRQLLVENHTAIYRVEEVVVTVRYSPSQF